MASVIQATAEGNLEIRGPVKPGFEKILTPEALDFLIHLHCAFKDRRRELLARRSARQAEFDAGKLPDFLQSTQSIREGDWQVAPIPADLADRRIEITGPVDRKMIINGLNSGARVFMADFEDASSPTWENMIGGQLNIFDAVRRQIDFTADNGKTYALNENPAVLMVRARGWHMEERHLAFEDEVLSAGLVDFGLCFFHNARALMERGSGPYFYLPKLESHLEARLWNDIFNFSQDLLGIPRGSIRATVLIETIPAAFEMDEILYELREHSAGLNCGRWDYIFSFIKCMQAHPEFVLPDRAQVTMDVHFLSSYSQLLVRTCHKRGIHAMGGMAAQIPIKNDPEANARAIEKVCADKEREARNGHDGSWVAHPDLIPPAMAVFDRYIDGPNQIANKREDVEVSAGDLLRVPDGTITMSGLRMNVMAAVHYMEQWLSGRGAVPFNNQMEDAATAEISRAQLWQWVKHPKGVLDSGERVTVDMVDRVVDEVLASLQAELGEVAFASRRYRDAALLLVSMVAAPTLPTFLTLAAYKKLD